MSLLLCKVLNLGDKDDVNGSKGCKFHTGQHIKYLFNRAYRNIVNEFTFLFDEVQQNLSLH